MNRNLVIIFLIILLGLGWYLISPAFIVIETDEISPLEVQEDLISEMDPAMKKLFDEEMEKMKDKIIDTNEDAPSNTEIIAQGNFIAQDHGVKGRAILISSPLKKTLRFEDFETINGPNLHIYLSTDLEANDYVDLGKIKATKGNVNYNVDPSIDLEKYDKVLVWCVPFKVLFSYAELN